MLVTIGHTEFESPCTTRLIIRSDGNTACLVSSMTLHIFVSIKVTLLDALARLLNHLGGEMVDTCWAKSDTLKFP